MTAAQIYIFLGMSVMVLTLATALVKAIYKIARIDTTMATLAETIKELSDKVDKLDTRMYENAVRGTQRR